MRKKSGKTKIYVLRHSNSEEVILYDQYEVMRSEVIYHLKLMIEDSSEY